MSQGAARDVFRAFQEAWEGTSESSTFDGLNGPFRDEAPAETPFPYCVFKAPINRRREQSSTTEYWDHTIELELFEREMDVVEDLVAAVGEIVDTFLLTPAIGSILYIRRIDERYESPDTNVSKGVLVYEILRGKPR